MFEHLLVPLDQSVLAESALPYARALAERFGSRITLLSVISPPQTAWVSWMPDAPEFHIEAYRKTVRAAEVYLADLQRSLQAHGLTVGATTAEGESVADAILKVAAERDCSAIVMSTHGRSGVQRLLLGSVAERILRHAAVPVLLVRRAAAAD